MKSADNIRPGQLIIETRARFTDPITNKKVKRAGVIEVVHKDKAEVFFYIGPTDPLDIPVKSIQTLWTEWDGVVNS